MTILMRSFHHREDFNIVREFLIETYNITKTYLNWIPSMFENIWRGPCGQTEYKDEEDEYVKIWENEIREVIAVTICKPSGECWIFIHPEHRGYENYLIEYLEKQQIDTRSDEEDAKMHFVVEAGDTHRETILNERGYENKGVCEHNRILPEYYEVTNITLAQDYTLRHADIEKEFGKYKAVESAVFKHCKNMTLKQAKIFSEAEFYTPELDIVVVAPDESFAAFATGRLDPVSKLAEVEPVGVHPEHRRKGLGKAVVLECIRRLQRQGAKAIVILGAASTEEATHLYDSLGFSRTNVNIWVKEI